MIGHERNGWRWKVDCWDNFIVEFEKRKMYAEVTARRLR